MCLFPHNKWQLCNSLVLNSPATLAIDLNQTEALPIGARCDGTVGGSPPGAKSPFRSVRGF
ncbi:hypothetical protein MPC4_10170 [Methylocella tundrae]|uniref:Uncharacterized protein n=1 Tax=Methylocella tundrae TaxID=227605 RepID=A0A8B6M1U9_METTU|nr:hypothetical protein MPC4_10170 [Methylocella tundrae]